MNVYCAVNVIIIIVPPLTLFSFDNANNQQPTTIMLFTQELQVGKTCKLRNPRLAAGLQNLDPQETFERRQADIPCGQKTPRPILQQHRQAHRDPSATLNPSSISDFRGFSQNGYTHTRILFYQFNVKCMRHYELR